VNYQYKKSTELEIYELEYTDPKTLQDTCDVRQPIIFYFAPLIRKYTPINLEVLRTIEKEDGNVLIVKDIRNYYPVTPAGERPNPTFRVDNAYPKVRSKSPAFRVDNACPKVRSKSPNFRVDNAYPKVRSKRGFTGGEAPNGGFTGGAHNNIENDKSSLNLKLPLPFQKVLRLFQADTTAPHFFSESNNEFIEETGIDNVMTKIGNKFLRPAFSVNHSFDLMTASKGVGLPMRFHTQTRKYLYVSSGRIMVKMAPYKYAKKLDFDKEFLVSPMNCWNPQLDDTPYINKVRFLEFEVVEGYMLYIPPYWIYSIFYTENDTCLLEYNYQTAMNIVAHPNGMIRSFINMIQILMKTGQSFTSSSNTSQDIEYYESEMSNEIVNENGGVEERPQGAHSNNDNNIQPENMEYSVDISDNNTTEPKNEKSEGVVKDHDVENVLYSGERPNPTFRVGCDYPKVRSKSPTFRVDYAHPKVRSKRGVTGGEAPNGEARNNTVINQYENMICTEDTITDSNTSYDLTAIFGKS